GGVVKGLAGTVTGLADSGSSRREMLRWLFTRTRRSRAQRPSMRCAPASAPKSNAEPKPWPSRRHGGDHKVSVRRASAVGDFTARAVRPYENATAGRPSDQLKLKAQVRAPWRRVFVSASQSHSFVAPGDPGLQFAQVVVRAADADGEERDAQVQELRAEFVRLALDAAG